MSNLDKPEETEKFFDSLHKVLARLPKEGDEGKFECPVCYVGEIRWLRVKYNGHLRLGCTTPGCIMMMQ